MLPKTKGYVQYNFFLAMMVTSVIAVTRGLLQQCVKLCIADEDLKNDHHEHEGQLRPHFSVVNPLICLHISFTVWI